MAFNIFANTVSSGRFFCSETLNIATSGKSHFTLKIPNDGRNIYIVAVANGDDTTTPATLAIGASRGD